MSNKVKNGVRWASFVTRHRNAALRKSSGPLLLDDGSHRRIDHVAERVPRGEASVRPPPLGQPPLGGPGLMLVHDQP